MQRMLILGWVLFASLSAYTQPVMKDYKDLWKKVDEAEKKGLTQTANEQVTAIFNLAAKEENSPQVIKAAQYRLRYRNMVEEESEKTNYFFTDSMTRAVKAPAKHILYSIQAEMLWTYLSQNRWQFYNRTELVEEKGNDITTWSIAKFHQTVAANYRESLKNPDLLKRTKIDEYDVLLEKGTNSRHLRPTLYDLLANRALTYFKNDEHDLAKPAYAFKIEQPEAFADAGVFAKNTFKTRDTGSLQYQALLIYRDLLAFHLNDAKPDALIDADIDRLEFVHSHSTLNNKEKLYEAALLQLEEKYAASPASAQAGYLRAQLYAGRGNGYDPLTRTDNQYEIKRAKELAEAIVKKYPTSEGGMNAANLLNGIKRPVLNIEAEIVNVAERPFRMLVGYRNMPRIYFRLVKTSHAEIRQLHGRDGDPYPRIVALKPLRAWNTTLPDAGDFQTHYIEQKIDALPTGMYLLLASANEGFTLKNNVVSKQVVHVSNIGFVQKGNAYHILHRETGQPLKNAEIQVYESRYNYQQYREEEVKAEKYTTNENGYFTLVKNSETRNILLDIHHGNDQLFLDNRYYASAEYDEKGDRVNEQRQTFLFTDRSIYRPGQTLYFKGLLVKKTIKPASATVVPNEAVTIQLKDANWQKVAELSLKSNEFGSYNGSFRLPEGLMNGQFSLWDSTNGKQVYISVEEYKRPKFFVEIPQPKGSYRVNDSIKVTGTAKAYAGNNIDGAQVKYRVVRRIQWPWWWGYWGWGRSIYPSGNEQMEITNGEATTNEKGEFTVTFKAIPDEAVKKEDQPTFYYEVSADVTDVNGETRSGEVSVPVSYQALQLKIDVADRLPADSFKTLGIGSTNINGAFEKADVQVSIYQLKSPGRFFRERYWRQPDQFAMSRDQYYTLFPYDIYKDELDKQRWEKGDRKMDELFATAENKKMETGKVKWQPGWYVIETVAKDKYGETVKAFKYVELIPANGIPNAPTPLEMYTGTPKAEPGETVRYKLTTTFNDVFVIHQQQRMYAEPKLLYERLHNNSKPFDVAVTETDRGGMGASAVFVKYNRVFGDAQTFAVPWSNKELNIRFETFRDKTLPGANEEYTVKISGYKGEKIAAEMLAAMYDASLDQFKPHYWEGLYLFPSPYGSYIWSGAYSFNRVNSEEQVFDSYEYKYYPKSYDRIPGIYGGYRDRYYLRGVKSMAPEGAEEMRKEAPSPAAANEVVVAGLTMNKAKAPGKKDGEADGVGDEQEKNKSAGNEGVQVRKNFNETAFFFPDLRTDAEGRIVIRYTIPEALTQWKLMTMAHTKDLASGTLSQTVITQKPLMVQPNAPRFLREGDQLQLVAKVVNLTDKEITGTAELQLIDATTNTPVDGWFKNIYPNQYFTAPAGQSVPVTFSLEVPFSYNRPLTYRVIAKAKDASDGEENVLPVVTNRMLVTETLPLPMRGNGTKKFNFEKLVKANTSTTLTHHAVTVEYTSNPAWYAVQALPYLMEYPFECAEQTFNRFYANALAAKIANSSPRIKAVFDKWKTIDKQALLSNLQKNQELKSALLQETPWVLEAKNEEQQKQNIGLLFDLVKMDGELGKAVRKLTDMQSPNGGYVWFKGGPDDRYITQYILTGIGHLKKLGALPGKYAKEMNGMVAKGLSYLDFKLKEDYDNLLRWKANLKNNNTGYTQIQYHYMRSFFPETAVAAASKTAYDYFYKQMQQYWLQHGKYMQGMIALATHRSNDTKTPAAILKSLKENAIVKEEMGMYWKDLTGGYYWYQAPIESMSLLIEAFSEAGKDTKAVDDLKTWLLKNKQTTNWKTTKATAEACYALLLEGSEWLGENPDVKIQLGSVTITPPANAEAGTGYFKQRIEGAQVKPDMGNIAVTVSNSKAGQVTSWGGVYWQYFENLDKITAAETPLKLNKKLFIERIGDKGAVLEAVGENAVLKVGDKIKVRIELRVDRDMEYVHMKDMRSSGTEPLNVISQYKWQGGLGYYESTKDASTNFFFHWLPKGTYVFEYPLFVTHKGKFSNGITTIQCMYAPEFTSHSEGVTVRVD